MISMTIDNAHLLPVADLVDRPGTSRPLDLRLDLPGELDLPLVEVADPASLRGVAESVVDGILVRGVVSTTLGVACARCLSPLEVEVESEVVELFTDPAEQDDPEEGYELVDGMIDLDTLLRDALVPAVPLQPLCREACAGLCAQCGARLDDGDCGCEHTTDDPRWAALSELRLPDGADDRQE